MQVLLLWTRTLSRYECGFSTLRPDTDAFYNQTLISLNFHFPNFQRPFNRLVYLLNKTLPAIENWIVPSIRKGVRGKLNLQVTYSSKFWGSSQNKCWYCISKRYEDIIAIIPRLSLLSRVKWFQSQNCILSQWSTFSKEQGRICSDDINSNSIQCKQQRYFLHFFLTWHIRT